MRTGVYVQPLPRSTCRDLPVIAAHAHVHAGHLHAQSAYVRHDVRVFNYRAADKSTGGATTRINACCWVVQPFVVHSLDETHASHPDVVSNNGHADDSADIGPRVSFRRPTGFDTRRGQTTNRGMSTVCGRERRDSFCVCARPCNRAQLVRKHAARAVACPARFGIVHLRCDHVCYPQERRFTIASKDQRRMSHVRNPAASDVRVCAHGGVRSTAPSVCGKTRHHSVTVCSSARDSGSTAEHQRPSTAAHMRRRQWSCHAAIPGDGGGRWQLERLACR